MRHDGRCHSFIAAARSIWHNTVSRVSCTRHTPVRDDAPTASYSTHTRTCPWHMAKGRPRHPLLCAVCHCFSFLFETDTACLLAAVRAHMQQHVHAIPVPSVICSPTLWLWLIHTCTPGAPYYAHGAHKPVSYIATVMPCNDGDDSTSPSTHRTGKSGWGKAALRSARLQRLKHVRWRRCQHVHACMRATACQLALVCIISMEMEMSARAEHGRCASSVVLRCAGHTHSQSD